MTLTDAQKDRLSGICADIGQVVPGRFGASLMETMRSKATLSVDFSSCIVHRMFSLELTLPRLKLISAVSSNFVTAALIGAGSSIKAPLYLTGYLAATILLSSFALNAE